MSEIKLGVRYVSKHLSYCVRVTSIGNGVTQVSGGANFSSIRSEKFAENFVEYSEEKELADYCFFAEEVRRVCGPTAQVRDRAGWVAGYVAPEAFIPEHGALVHYRGPTETWTALTRTSTDSILAQGISLVGVLSDMHAKAARFYIEQRAEAEDCLKKHQELQEVLFSRLREQHKHRHLCYMEPGENGEARKVIVTVEEAIAAARVHAKVVRPYEDVYAGSSGDKLALEDYIALHWAYYCTDDGIPTES